MKSSDVNKNVIPFRSLNIFYHIREPWCCQVFHIREMRQRSVFAQHVPQIDHLAAMAAVKARRNCEREPTFEIIRNRTHCIQT
jgi:hypothetical protein